MLACIPGFSSTITSTKYKLIGMNIQNSNSQQLSIAHYILINSFIQNMKSLTVKQAERWFEKLKTNNLNAFKELLKQLKKFQKSNDQYQCFVKMNGILLEHPELTREINTYLEEPNKFIVNRTEVQRINQLVKYVRKIKPQAFQEIVAMIKDLSSNKSDLNLSEEEQNKILKEFVLEKVRGNIELENYAEKALNYSAEEMIIQLDLSHLNKVQKPAASNNKVEEFMEMAMQPDFNLNKRIQDVGGEGDKKIKVYPPFININEEKMFIRNLDKYLTPEDLKKIFKLIEIYRLGIVSKSEILQFVQPFLTLEYEGIKDIIESRENDRRRNCSFKPLNDMDFTKSERATRSYVNMPSSYPHICSSSSTLTQEVLNKKWVSVPQGSEDHFNLRVRNNFEQNIIKSEDDRYQLDINLKRMNKSQEILDQIIEKLHENPSADVSVQLNFVLRLGTLQYIYKNITKELKEQFEYYMKVNPLKTCGLYRQRLNTVITELVNLRNLHMKLWKDISIKNSVKALDFKGNQFKRIQKFKMKGNVFLDELKAKVLYLEKRGKTKDFDTPFESKKQFFEVLNSFETSSRKERCQQRKIVSPTYYDINNYQVPTLLPVMIMAFEDQQALNLSISYLFFYIDHSINNEGQKTKYSQYMRIILSEIFGIKKIKHRKINSQVFDEEKFLNILRPTVQDQTSRPLALDQINQNWVQVQKQTTGFVMEVEEFDFPKLNYFNDKPSQNGYQPAKADDNLVFYASQNFYIFLRYFYAIYQRLIRLFEICNGDVKKPILFELLYFNFIKTKQNTKFQECLNNLLGQDSFMFTTFYRLVEGLLKSVSNLTTCVVTNYSLKLLPVINNEDLYLILLNKFYLLQNLTNPRIIRFTYYKDTSQLLYINCLESFFKPDQQYKQLVKRRMDISNKVETYTVMKDFFEWKNIPNNIPSNKMEYHFEGNSIKLMGLKKGEDVIVNSKYRCDDKKSRMMMKRMEKEIKKIKIVNDYLS